jgi:D-amino-acid oxidase
MPQHLKKITIVGGGVSGLTTASCLAETCTVTLVGESIGVHSNSVKATAVWHIYLVPESDQVLSWGGYTLLKLYELAEQYPESGIELVRGVELFRNSEPVIPSWAHIPKLFRMLSPYEVAEYNKLDNSLFSEPELATLRQHPVRWGYHIEAPAASMKIYLNWLEREVVAKGVKISSRRIANFRELEGESDVIVNCSGFGARTLVPDNTFIPYKGQYFILKSIESDSPKTYIGDDDHPVGMAYMIPRAGEVMVGGCAEKGREDMELTLDFDDTIKRAGLYVPWLRTRSRTDQSGSAVVCLRPARRDGIRLAADITAASVPVIHNYGHGGSGWSLSWGCAEAVVSLVENL